ncbi:MAG: hypothetical protein ACREN5_06220 [Gemmatimonadales bacterium]
MGPASKALAVLLIAAAMPAAAQQRSAPDTAQPPADTAPSITLLREVFSYEGTGRDPFVSLLRSGEIRPLINDLRLVSIMYDARYPARSVAVLRDLVISRTYRVRQGEVIGRLRVSAIRPREIVFTVQEYGFDRQQTLSLARQQEERP